MASAKAAFALLCLSFLSLAVCGSEDKEYQFWTYDMQKGKDGWAANFPLCGKKSQSPVDLTEDNEKDSPGRLTLTNFDTTKNVRWYITNNGHSAKVSYESGHPMISGGGLDGEYKVAQFHFHWGSDKSQGSEHTVGGKRYPMEMHVVSHNVKYKDVVSALGKKDGLAILGVFFKIAKDDDDDDKKHSLDALETLVSKFKKIREPGQNTSVKAFPLNLLLPKNQKKYFRYTGSLTAPPCSGKVTWTVYRRPVTVTNKQLDAFRTKLLDVELKPLVDNFRFIQPLGKRKIIFNTKR